MPKKRRDSSIGSGVIMNSAGYILTNAHVIQNANEISITLNDGRQAQAKLIGLDTDTDLAVVNIQLENLPQIPIGNSSELKIGDIVLAIGNPYNFGQTVTQGIVSATSRKRRGISYFDDFIQTDADINLGNSGGALVTAAGELIGINTAIVSSSGGSEGIGLATPINQALDVMNQIIENGKVVRGWLGIEAQTLGTDVIKMLNLETGGVLVNAIMRNSPAENAGLIPGDIMISIDGKNLSSPDQAIETITELTPGSEVKINILRGWERQELITKIAQRPATQMPN
jgi:serine peptidase DegS